MGEVQFESSLHLRSIVGLLFLSVCGEEINTACCSSCALQWFEWCRLDTVAAPAAESESIDGGEILPVIEDLKWQSPPKRPSVKALWCCSSGFASQQGFSSCMHIVIKKGGWGIQYSVGEPCCSFVWLLCNVRPWRCFRKRFLVHSMQRLALCQSISECLFIALQVAYFAFML